MSHFERDLYEEELPPDEWQQRWWDYVAKFQGVVPPGEPRAATSATPAPRPTSTTTPPQYYDYALATMIKFQLHDHICTQDPQAGRARLRLLGQQGGRQVPEGHPALGATRDWRDGHQGGDRRADLAARDDGVLPAARRRAGQAQRRARTARGDPPRFAAAVGLVLAALNGPGAPHRTPGRVPSPSGDNRAGPSPPVTRMRLARHRCRPRRPAAPRAAGRARARRGARAFSPRTSASPTRRCWPRSSRSAPPTSPWWCRSTRPTAPACELGLHTRFSPTLDAIAETVRAAQPRRSRGHAVPHRPAVGAARG